jgi:hypothetical protein
MNLGLYAFLAVATAGAILLLVRGAVGLYSYFHFRGTRLVTCPETKRAAAVEIDAAHVGLTSALGMAPRLRLEDCSRWQVRERCDEPCLSQLENAPEECLVRRIVTLWYEGKDCAFCHQAIPPVEWPGHQPALMDPNGRTVQWHEVPPEQLPEVLASFRPVCWNCHVTETFRREHPEMVVERPKPPDSKQDAA